MSHHKMLLCILWLCIIVHIGSGTALQEVHLNSTLIQGRYALPDQHVTFTCESRGTEGMEWFSEEYIGVGGDFIEIFSGDDGSNQTRRGGMTVATRVGVYSDSGITVIVSQLHITASEQFPMSSVACRINSRGPIETISFNITDIRSLQEVHLNSTLIQGRYALPGQRVTFTCESRGTEGMEWFSEEYIGVGGDFIEIFSGDDGSNQTRQGGRTVATRERVYDESGITVIVSQLHITASELFPLSSVTCRINSRGPIKTINFSTTESIPTTTDSEVMTVDPMITTVMEASEGRSSSDGCNCTGLIIGISILGVFLLLFIVGTFFVIYCCKYQSRPKDTENEGETKMDGPANAWTTDKPRQSTGGTNVVDLKFTTEESGDGNVPKDPSGLKTLLYSGGKMCNDPSGILTVLNMGDQGDQLRIQELEHTVKDLRRQVQELESKVKGDQVQIQELEEEKTDLEQTVENLGRQLQELEDKVKKGDQVRVQELEKEKKDLEQTVEDLRRQLQELEGKMKNMSQQIDELKKENEHLKEEQNKHGMQFRFRKTQQKDEQK